VGFYSYQILKAELRKNYPQYAQNPIFDFLFGGLGGVVAQISFYFKNFSFKTLIKHFYIKKSKLNLLISNPKSSFLSI